MKEKQEKEYVSSLVGPFKEFVEYRKEWKQRLRVKFNFVNLNYKNALLQQCDITAAVKLCEEQDNAWCANDIFWKLLKLQTFVGYS